MPRAHLWFPCGHLFSPFAHLCTPLCVCTLSPTFLSMVTMEQRCRSGIFEGNEWAPAKGKSRRQLVVSAPPNTSKSTQRSEAKEAGLGRGGSSQEHTPRPADPVLTEAQQVFTANSNQNFTVRWSSSSSCSLGGATVPNQL